MFLKLIGCWRGNADCDRYECIATENINHRHLNNSRFCCCSSFNCNANFSFVFTPKKRVKFFPDFLPSISFTERKFCKKFSMFLKHKTFSSNKTVGKRETKFGYNNSDNFISDNSAGHWFDFYFMPDKNEQN